MKKLLSSAVAIASVIGVCALPSQVSAGADSSSGDILGIAGSDTTTFVMDALSAAHNTNSRYNPNKDRAVNIPPLVAANPNVELGESTATAANKAWLADARSTWPGGMVLPADNDCKVNLVFGGYGSRDTNTDGDTNDGTAVAGLAPEGGTAATADLNADTLTTGVGETWYLGLVPPNGSGAGRGAMEGTATNGMIYNGASGPGASANSACIDIARSSSKSFNAKREGWAFALDAIPITTANRPTTVFNSPIAPSRISSRTRSKFGNACRCVPCCVATFARRFGRLGIGPVGIGRMGDIGEQLFVTHQ